MQKKEINLLKLGKSCLVAALVCFFLYGQTDARAQTVSSVPTEVFVGICGDGIVHPGQDCDDGEAGNTGEYATSIEARNCGPDCSWGPYCGDGIVQSQFGEECDDGTNTDDGFCTADCKALPPQSGPGGFGGGGGTFDPGEPDPIGNTFITVQGKAYPNSNVNILKDGNVIGVVSTDSLANFTFTSSDIEPGVATFGFWAEDHNGLQSISYTVTFEVLEGSSTTVSGVFIPPTIDLEETALDVGDPIRISGQSAPEVVVEAHIHSENVLIEEVSTDQQGIWSMEIDTAPLEIGQHTARALFKIDSGGSTLESSFSRAITFFLGVPEGGTGSADLNGDGAVNLIDFSILLFHWGTSNPIADINGNGSVGIADFSIMLFQWTG